jgi:hypothetical protein
MNVTSRLPETTRHFGTLVYIHGSTVVISDELGVQHSLTIADDAGITCHRKNCGLSNLTVGTIVRVIVRLEDDVVTSVECLRTAPPSETK